MCESHRRLGTTKEATRRRRGTTPRVAAVVAAIPSDATPPPLPALTTTADIPDTDVVTAEPVLVAAELQTAMDHVTGAVDVTTATADNVETPEENYRRVLTNKGWSESLIAKWFEAGGMSKTPKARRRLTRRLQKEHDNAVRRRLHKEHDSVPSTPADADMVSVESADTNEREIQENVAGSVAETLAATEQVPDRVNTVLIETPAPVVASTPIDTTAGLNRIALDQAMLGLADEAYQNFVDWYCGGEPVFFGTQSELDEMLTNSGLLPDEVVTDPYADEREALRMQGVSNAVIDLFLDRGGAELRGSARRKLLSNIEWELKNANRERRGGKKGRGRRRK